MAAPRYKTLANCFIAPYYVKAGSVIEFTGEPGDQLEPLNDEAQAAMDAWYTKEFTYIDDKTGLEKTVQPNIGKRPATVEAGEIHAFALVADPPKDDPKDILGLAEALAQRGTPAGEAQPGGAILMPVDKPTNDGEATILAEPVDNGKTT